MTTLWNPLYWVSEHWGQLLALAAFFVFLYRVYLVIRKLLLYPEAIISTEENLKTMMTNHLPHLQLEIEQTNAILSGVREDFKELRNDFRIILAARLQ